MSNVALNLRINLGLGPKIKASMAKPRKSVEIISQLLLLMASRVITCEEYFSF